MKRTPLKRTTNLKRRTPLSASSKTQSATDYERELDLVTPWLVHRSNHECEAGIPSVCEVFGSHRHHRKRRGQGGQNTLENLLWVCSACHAWIHAHVEAALRCGYLVRSTDDPAEVPIDHSQLRVEDVPALERAVRLADAQINLARTLHPAFKPMFRLIEGGKA